MKSAQRKRADQVIAKEMAAYRSARVANDSATAWKALERAHIVSQPYLGPHLSNHWIMLQFAVFERNVGEVIGQIARLALAPLGSLTGRIPVGNTGRSNVSAFEPMPIPEDLRDTIAMHDR
jgi:Protein of unknown function (DUF3703)